MSAFAPERPGIAHELDQRSKKRLAQRRLSESLGAQRAAGPILDSMRCSSPLKGLLRSRLTWAQAEST